jgi:hypothetical protein
MLSRLSVVLACAVLLAGCGGEPVAEADKILIPSTSSPLGPADGGASTAAKEKRKPARKSVVAPTAGVAFKAPVGWTVLDKETIRSTGGERAEALAQEVGMSAEALEAMVAAVDVYLTDYSGVLTVGRYAGAMPTQEAFEAQFGGAAASVEPVRTRSTPLGDGRLFGYRLTIGGVTQSGGSLYLANGSSVVEITSAGPDGNAALEVLDAVTATLRRS